MLKPESSEEFSNAYDKLFKKDFDLYGAELEAVRRLIPPPKSEGMEVGVEAPAEAEHAVAIELPADPGSNVASLSQELRNEGNPRRNRDPKRQHAVGPRVEAASARNARHVCPPEELSDGASESSRLRVI